MERRVDEVRIIGNRCALVEKIKVDLMVTGDWLSYWNGSAWMEEVHVEVRPAANRSRHFDYLRYVMFDGLKLLLKFMLGE